MESSPPESTAKQQVDLGLVDVFAELADLFGNPRSHGQIYGLLFSSQTPLCMDDIIARIGISKGSASLGLRALEDTRSSPLLHLEGSYLMLIFGAVIWSGGCPQILGHFDDFSARDHRTAGFVLPASSVSRRDTNRLPPFCRTVRRNYYRLLYQHS